MIKKGIILAGGKGTRLYPSTKAISKQMLPIYNKPMVYYPLSTLMLMNIKEILIISTPQDVESYKRLLNDGSNLGLNIQYSIQDNPRGIPEAFLIGENFINNSNCVLILGDNIFYGHDLENLLNKNLKINGCTIFTYNVSNPEDFGVLVKRKKKIEIIEKPKKFISDKAITGLYFFDKNVTKFSKTLKVSKRKELEITDLLKIYQKKNKLKSFSLKRGYAWLDTGTINGYLSASNFIHAIETRQGQMVACIEEIALRKKFINLSKFKKLIDNTNSEYNLYLKKIYQNAL